MTYESTQATTDFNALVLSMTEFDFYNVILQANSARDFAFASNLMRAQSDARKAKLINF